MKFDELVNYILNEADGVDPWKYAYKGSPAGFRKDTGVSNPEKFVPDSPSRKMYNTADVDPSKRIKAGEYIGRDIHSMINTALIVTSVDPEAGTELKRVLEIFAQPYHEYQAARGEYTRLRQKLERASSLTTVGQKFRNDKEAKSAFRGGKLKQINNKQRKYIDWLETEILKYETLANEAKAKFEAVTPEVLDAVQDLVREGSASFAQKISDDQKKAVEQGEDNIVDFTNMKAIQFLKDVWRGKTDFEPLLKFAEVEKMNGKNPLPRLLTLYKNAADTIVRNNLINSPERTLSYLTGITGKIRTMVEPTKGRTLMKQKDLNLSKVIVLIKARKYNEAKAAVNNTKLDNAAKTDLMIKIDKLSKGGMSEADVIRPLYQQ